MTDILPFDFNWREVELVRAIDWNTIEDDKDKEIFDRCVSNFWVPERIALSNDLNTWETLTEEEKKSTSRVFAGLTLLDTIQGEVGAISLMADARTAHEKAVYTNFAFMEEVHAKSYSSIFSTFLNSSEIEDAFRWSREDENLKKKAAIILNFYRGDDPLKRKIASVMLESFLFYSGFFMPLYWASKSKLTRTSDLISYIIRDEAVHGYYIGYKYQLAIQEETAERQEELKKFTIELMKALYENEVKYTAGLYDNMGLTEEVTIFLRYNANKALVNLGYEPLYSPEETNVLSTILSSLSPVIDDNADFFSQTPNYVIGATKVEKSEDEDWDF